MSRTLYCWRCQMDIPMLDEHEWKEVMAAVTGDRGKGGVFGQAALERYFEITGFRETNVAALGHHRLRLLGPPCSACGKPLRTPRAKLCAECGTIVTSPD